MFENDLSLLSVTYGLHDLINNMSTTWNVFLRFPAESFSVSGEL
jgi:hypothetical protein